LIRNDFAVERGSHAASSGFDPSIPLCGIQPRSATEFVLSLVHKNRGSREASVGVCDLLLLLLLLLLGYSESTESFRFGGRIDRGRECLTTETSRSGDKSGSFLSGRHCYADLGFLFLPALCLAVVLDAKLEHPPRRDKLHVDHHRRPHSAVEYMTNLDD